MATPTWSATGSTRPNDLLRTARWHALAWWALTPSAGGATGRCWMESSSGARSTTRGRDEPWVVDGAAVRVSLVCFAGKNAQLPTQLNGEKAPRINADLTSATVDLTQARRLPQNVGVAFMGDTKGGPFDYPRRSGARVVAVTRQPERSAQR